MTLYICEKPSQARDLASVLGKPHRGDGVFEGSGWTVTWCFGHLLELASPDQYDDSLKSWSLDTLPITPDQWQFFVKKDAKKQFNIIKALVKKSKDVVVATDADREGEMIAREILDFCQYKGMIRRLWLTALDPVSIKRALDDIWPGEKTENLYHAGLARSRADWLVGMNLTRAYTLLARNAGHDNVFSVGRVQTPTLRLIVDRDRTIENFKPSNYYEIYIDCQAKDRGFRAKWAVPEDHQDDEGRCVDKAFVVSVARSIKAKTGTIEDAQTERKKQAPPALYDLSSLQQEASGRYGYSAQDVLDIAQSLYEKHKATTYPRTDCKFMPESQHGDATSIFTGLKSSDENFSYMVVKANATLKSKVWNDKKITAHHAIVPTAKSVNISTFSDKELKVYDLIRRRYVSQFYPDHEYAQTRIAVTVANHLFKATGRVALVSGWKELIQEKQDMPSNDEEAEQSLPSVAKNDKVGVEKVNAEEKLTKPPARYTEKTLLSAMESVGKFVENSKLKKILKDTAGLGTPATRGNIIETLKQRDYIRVEKKSLVSTPAGQALIDVLPGVVKDPATTAVWEQYLDAIAAGNGTLDLFMTKQAGFIGKIVALAKQTAEQGGKTAFNDSVVKYDCPQCKKPLKRRKGKEGYFWGCSDYPNCKTTLPDSKGKPGKKAKAKKQRI